MSRFVPDPLQRHTDPYKCRPIFYPSFSRILTINASRERMALLDIERLLEKYPKLRAEVPAEILARLWQD